jgi:hypothetical protein
LVVEVDQVVVEDLEVEDHRNSFVEDLEVVFHSSALEVVQVEVDLVEVVHEVEVQYYNHHFALVEDLVEVGLVVEVQVEVEDLPSEVVEDLEVVVQVEVVQMEWKVNH